MLGSEKSLKKLALRQLFYSTNDINFVSVNYVLTVLKSQSRTVFLLDKVLTFDNDGESLCFQLQHKTVCCNESKSEGKSKSSCCSLFFLPLAVMSNGMELLEIATELMKQKLKQMDALLNWFKQWSEKIVCEFFEFFLGQNEVS